MAAQLAIGCVEPYRAIGVLASRHQASFAAASPDIQTFDPPLLNQDHTGGFGSDPEVALAVLEEKHNSACVQPCRVVLIKHSKSNSVETHQAIQRSQPEVAVASLCNRNHRVLRQPIFGFFYVDDIRGISAGDRFEAAGISDEAAQSNSQVAA